MILTPIMVRAHDDDQMRYIGALVNEAQVEALDKLAQRLGGCSRAAALRWLIDREMEGMTPRGIEIDQSILYK